LIVLRPVSYLFFRFAHVTTALTVTRDQIAGLGKGSTYLGNNASLISFVSSTSLKVSGSKMNVSEYLYCIVIAFFFL
ncbi:hypothetical protein, partial [Vibrio cholerae]|uniref:hypothetical protein n=1 Tax=Vibrio cholerae TaxID=666 RepID=UPI003019937D